MRTDFPPTLRRLEIYLGNALNFTDAFGDFELNIATLKLSGYTRSSIADGLVMHCPALEGLELDLNNILIFHQSNTKSWNQEALSARCVELITHFSIFGPWTTMARHAIFTRPEFNPHTLLIHTAILLDELWAQLNENRLWLAHQERTRLECLAFDELHSWTLASRPPPVGLRRMNIERLFLDGFSAAEFAKMASQLVEAKVVLIVQQVRGIGWDNNKLEEHVMWLRSADRNKQWIKVKRL